MKISIKLISISIEFFERKTFLLISIFHMMTRLVCFQFSLNFHMKKNLRSEIQWNLTWQFTKSANGSEKKTEDNEGEKGKTREKILRVQNFPYLKQINYDRLRQTQKRALKNYFLLLLFCSIIFVLALSAYFTL